MSQNYKVLVVGSWHLGSVVGTGIATRGHEVHLWDQNENVRKAWSNGVPPIHEPGLLEASRPHFNENLFWTDTPEEIAKLADWIVLSYDTPINEQDEVQLDSVFSGFERILRGEIASHANFFFTSQLPVGTSRKLLSKLKSRFPSWTGNVLYQPENLRLGTALDSLRNPDRVALGFDTEMASTRDALEKEFRTLFGLPNTPIDRMSLESAEMVKHALNAYLATCVVFGNELSEICEQTKANAWDVVRSLKKDSRVGGKAPLFPGLAFSGGTLARDIKTLSPYQTSGGNLFSKLYASNEKRNHWVLDKLKESLPSLKEKTILLLGVTYKAGTSTVRRSPAIQIGHLLKEEGAICLAVDPKADLEELTAEEKKSLPFSLSRKTDGLFEKADAVLLLTEWPEFSDLSWETLKTKTSPSLLIDTKNFLVKADQSHWQRKIPGIPKEIK